MAYASSSRLSADLGRACVDKEGADVHLVARDRSRFPAHRAVISCRSEVLGALLLLSEGEQSDSSGGGGAGRLIVVFCYQFFCHNRAFLGRLGPHVYRVFAISKFVRIGKKILFIIVLKPTSVIYKVITQGQTKKLG